MSNGTTRNRSRAGGLGVVIAIGALGVAAGPLGLGAGVVLLVSWFVLPTVFAFALGQLLFALAVVDPPLVEVVFVELGLVTMLVGTTPRGNVLRVASVTAVGIVGLSGVALWVGQQTGALWPAALALLGTVAVFGYGMHRYESVRLGLVGADR